MVTQGHYSSYTICGWFFFNRSTCFKTYKILYRSQLAITLLFSTTHKNSFSGILKGQYTLGDKLQQHVAATRCNDKSQRQIASCVLENFCENLCRCNRICRPNKLHRFSLIWFFATCCSDKILLRRQKFSQKFSSTHEAIWRCNVSPHLVAATSHPTCAHGVICRCNVLQQLVA